MNFMRSDFLANVLGASSGQSTRPSIHRIGLLFVPAFVLAMGLPMQAGAVTLKTVAKSGGWTSSTTWSPSGFPNASTLYAKWASGTGYSVALNNDVSIGSLNFSSGNTGTGLNGTGKITIYGDDGTGATAVLGSFGGGTVSIACNVGLGRNNLLWDIRSSSASGLTVSGVISDNGGSGLQKSNTGVLTLSGANTYSGTTVISAGTLKLGNLLALQNSAYDTTGSNGSTIGLDVNGYTTPTLGGLSGSVNLASAIVNYSTVTALTLNPQSGTVTYSGVIANGSGNLNLTKSGAGKQILSGANTYSGTTTVSGGTLAYGINDAIGSGAVTVNGAAAVLDMGTYSDTVGLVTLTAGSITGSGGTLTSTSGFTMNNAAAATVSAILGGSVGLTKSDVGTLTLSAANTYSGTTTINAGTLALGASGSLNATPALTISGGATFDVSAIVNYTGLSSGTLSTTSPGANPAVIKGGTTVDLGSQPISLASDFIHPSLQVSGGELKLNGNTITIVGTGTIVAGLYTLIDGSTVGGSTISGTPNVTPTLSGCSLADGAVATLEVSGGDLKMRVQDNRQPLKWATGNGTWDSAGVDNWKDKNDTPTKYLAGDVVIFEDDKSSGSAIAVTIDADVSPASVTVGASKAYTISGPGKISGATGLIKSGTGTLTLSSANDYSGATTFSAGTLAIGNDSALGGGTLAWSGGILSSASSDAHALGNAVTVDGNVTLGSASNTGTLTFNSTVALGSATRTLTVASDVHFANVISATGAYGISKAGAGKLTLSAANTYSGTTTVTAGTLAYGINDAIDGGDVTVNGATAVLDMGTYSDTVGAVTLTAGSITGSGGTLTSTSGFTMNNAAAATVSAILGGSVGLTKSGAGVLTLSAANTYSGITTVTAGTLAYGINNAIDGGDVTVNGATAVLDMGTYSDTVGTVTLTAGSIIGSGTLTSNSGFTMNNTAATSIDTKLAGTGALTKTTGAGTLTLTGDNSYSGGTTISVGGLEIGHNNALGSGTLALNGGTLSSASSGAHAIGNTVTVGGNVALGSASNTGTLTFNGTVALGSATRTLTVASDVHFANVISATGAFGISKAGAGKLTLSAANTYSGTTTVTAGTLAYGINDAIDGGAVTVNGATAVLDMGTYSDTVGAVTLTAGSITGSGTLTSDTSFTMNNTSATSVSAKLAGTGALTKSGTGILTLTGDNSYSGATVINAGGGLAIGHNNALGSGVLGLLNDCIISSDSTTPRTIANTLSTVGRVYFGDAVKNGKLTFTSAAFPLTNTQRQLILSSDVEIDGVVTSTTTSGGIKKDGSATLTLSGANTYNGPTQIIAGVLKLGNALALQYSAYITTGSNGSTIGLDVNGFTTPTLGGLSGSVALLSAMINYNTVTAITLNPQSGTVTYSGTIADGSGSLNLIKSGAGTQVLSVANTYTGTTTINAGTLKLAAGGSIDDSNGIVINPGGVLDVTAKTTLGSQSYTFGVDPTGTGSAGTISAVDLNIGSASVTVTGAPDDPYYVLATYTGTLTGTFTSETLPANYHINYNFHNLKQIVLEKNPQGSIFGIR